jgi:putative oxygen-independent coproporphyrinogen III oxidase
MFSPTAVYLHIPFCHRRCFYCDFPVKVIGDRRDGSNFPLVDRYLAVLSAEIEATPPGDRPLETLFLGGGTPSLLTVSQLQTLLQVLQRQFQWIAQPEISIEIDPGTFDRSKLEGYRDLGVNRFSLGVQAFQDPLLHGTGRAHTLADVYTAIDHLHQAQIPNWSLDLISGLPGQSIADWDWSLQEAIGAQPTHLSLYDLVLEPQTVFGKRYSEGRNQPQQTPLPPEELSAECYRLSHDRLTQAGYDHYEISNYAQPSYPCRHNRTYWKNQPYYGFGMGATSYIESARGWQRVARPRTLAAYETWVEEYRQAGEEFWLRYETDTPTDRFLETLMLGLRLREGVDLNGIAPYCPEKIQPLLQALSPDQQRNWVRFYHPKDDRRDHPKDQPRNQPYPHLQLVAPEGFLFSNQVLSKIFSL